MIQVPEEFRPHQLRPYPPDNDLNFEEWFYKVYDKSREKDREYLPIFWTSFYSNHRMGQDKRAMKRLQMFLDHSLDKTRKYFTIIQWDDGILNNVSHLDLKVFGMGCKGDYQLPLVCQPHKYEFKENGRPIFASFIGAVTHPIRQKMIDELKDKEDYFISTERTSLHTYCKIMSMSKFCICCRGYGANSFRIQEAMQYGAIPINISDIFLDPTGQDFNDYGLKINDLEVGLIDYYLKRISDKDYENKKARMSLIYRELYTFEGVKNSIYELLEREVKTVAV